VLNSVFNLTQNLQLKGGVLMCVKPL